MTQILMLCDNCVCNLIRKDMAVPHYQDTASKHGGFGVHYINTACAVCRKTDACALTTVKETPNDR